MAYFLVVLNKTLIDINESLKDGFRRRVVSPEDQYPLSGDVWQTLNRFLLFAFANKELNEFLGVLRRAIPRATHRQSKQFRELLEHLRFFTHYSITVDKYPLDYWKHLTARLKNLLTGVEIRDTSKFTPQEIVELHDFASSYTSFAKITSEEKRIREKFKNIGMVYYEKIGAEISDLMEVVEKQRVKESLEHYSTGYLGITKNGSVLSQTGDPCQGIGDHLSAYEHAFTISKKWDQMNIVHVTSKYKNEPFLVHEVVQSDIYELNLPVMFSESGRATLKNTLGRGWGAVLQDKFDEVFRLYLKRAEAGLEQIRNNEYRQSNIVISLFSGTLILSESANQPGGSHKKAIEEMAALGTAPPRPHTMICSEFTLKIILHTLTLFKENIVSNYLADQAEREMEVPLPICSAFQIESIPPELVTRVFQKGFLRRLPPLPIATKLVRASFLEDNLGTSKLCKVFDHSFLQFTNTHEEGEEAQRESEGMQAIRERFPETFLMNLPFFQNLSDDTSENWYHALASRTTDLRNPTWIWNNIRFNLRHMPNFVMEAFSSHEETPRLEDE